jgi:pSer/pThr/pTyr-binding forkhead associated (FHA) protein
VPPGNDLGDLVGLHTVPDADKELSRNHLELRLDGWSVTLVDLGSVNGTWVANPGKDPVRVRPHAPHPVVLGATVRLAEVTSFVLEPPA